MDADHKVIAVGQSWQDLEIERSVLAKQNIDIVDGRQLSDDDPLWGQAEGILLGTATKLDAGRLKGLPACRGIVRYGIGYDNVDVETAETLGIPVGIVRDYCLEEVAEHAIAAALALARGLPHWDRNVRAGAWRSGPRPTMRKFSELTFAIIGIGLIGREVGRRALALFGEVIVFDPHVTADAELRADYRFVDTLDDVLKDADILTLHVPLTNETDALLGAAELARMKQGAIVINVSRGGIVDETALLESLRNGHLGGAAIDTFVGEPMAEDHPLKGEPRVLLSPHVAWLSEESETKLRVRASEEIAKLVKGEAPQFPVTRIQVSSRQ